MRGFSENVVFAICRTLFGAAFVWAAWTKIIDPGGFAGAIANYDLLPYGLVGFTAAVLPWLELTCGILLIAGVWVTANALVLNALLVFFTAALSVSMVRGLDIACGCFSLDAQTRGSLWGVLLRDVAMLCVGLWIWMRSLRKPNASPTAMS
jgi:uncharacterized membrane protein YphA (DoxX/SURF4 family)